MSAKVKQKQRETEASIKEKIQEFKDNTLEEKDNALEENIRQVVSMR